MLIHFLILVLSFAIILAGSEMFTNGIEWAGQRLKISEAAVGSLLAAVGTALPETFIPAVALLSGPKDYTAHSAVGVGAIMGAPLMLSTLALFVMGIAAIGFRKRRVRIAMKVPPEHVRRDLSAAVSRAPVDHQHLDIGTRHVLRADRLQTAGKVQSPVLDRHDDARTREVRHGVAGHGGSVSIPGFRRSIVNR